MNKSELEKQIAEVKELIKIKQNEIDSFELDVDSYREEFDNALDECNEEVKIGGCTYSPSYVLKNIDETAYRCGLNDYVDGVDKEQTKQLEEELESVNEEIN
jgi:hypothetical protein